MSDKLKNYLGWAVIIGLLVLAGAVWRYVGAYERSIQPSSFRSFAVSGEGRVVVVPDIARFTFSVITEGGTDIGKLQTDNTAKINQAISFLKDQSVDVKDIKTENYNLSPRYQNVICNPRANEATRVCPPPLIVGYAINQSVSVKIRKDNFGKIGDVLTGVIRQGANNVSQLNFTVDDKTLAENEARAQAIAEAKVKARTVAKAADFSLGKLLSINEDDGYDASKIYSLEASRGRAAAATAPVIEPGSQEIRVNVTLRYEID